MPNLNEVPIIRLELERMKYSMMQMINPEVIAEEMQKAMDTAASQINFCKIAEQELTRGLHEAMKNEIHRFFSYGPGNKRVKKLLLEALQEDGE